MKIRMITRAIGPTVNMEPDKVYDVDEKQAKALVDGKFATYVDQPVEPKPEVKVEPKKEPVKETAELKVKKETATAK